MAYVICCDFDGTVTETDTIVQIVNHFLPEQGAPLVEAMLANKLSIQDGVTKLFSLLQSAQRQEIIDYTLKHVPVRSGFQRLLDTAAHHHIPFYIVSGGMHFFIDPVLNRFQGITAVYANEVEMSEKYMKVIWQHPCDKTCSQSCGTCKPSIMRKIKGDAQVIVIGDSLTDRLVAEEADVLFTTSRLTDYAKANHLQYYPFETFDDITGVMEEIVCSHGNS